MFLNHLQMNAATKAFDTSFMFYVELSVFSFCNHLISSGDEVKVAMGRKFGKMIPIIMQKYSKRPETSLHQHLKNYVVSVETLRDAARYGIYRGDPESYWCMVLEHYGYIMDKFVPINIPVINGLIIYCGLNLIDESCLENVHGDVKHYPVLKTDVYTNLIKKVVLNNKTPEAANCILKEINTGSWRQFLQNSKNLDELIQALNMIKAGKNSSSS
jgi:hypothetical protein